MLTVPTLCLIQQEKSQLAKLNDLLDVEESFKTKIKDKVATSGRSKYKLFPQSNKGQTIEL